MGNNIILIGMPASGKSTVGVILAKVLGFDFLDTDLVIQNRTGRRLEELIEERGPEGFMQLEDEINSSIEASHSIIATGGSAVYGKRQMAHFQQMGIILYLKCGFEVISSRLDDIRGRGVVLKEGQGLWELYEERCPLYEKYADITVDEQDGGIEKCVIAAAAAYQEAAGRLRNQPHIKDGRSM